MRKTDHTSNFGHGTFEDRTLDDKELDAVTGGMLYFNLPAPPKGSYCELTSVGVRKPRPPPARLSPGNVQPF
jgi:bacteriocin-like protein